MKTIQSIFVGIMLLAAITSCKKDEQEQAIITMTVATNGWNYEIWIYLSGNETAVIDWGDGSTNDTIELSSNTAILFRHNYTNERDHEIKIYGNSIKSLKHNSTRLTSLDVSKNIALVSLDCSSNNLASLDVSKNTALTTFDCSNNRLTSLDVSKNTALTSLRCRNNRLMGLDVSENTALTNLNCGSNELTGLDVSKNTALTNLICSSNELMSLDVSKNTVLTYLDGYHNQLTSLDASKNTALTFLRCEYSQLSASALDSLFGSLHSNTILGKIIYVSGNPGSDACNPSIAREKGWAVH